MAPSRSSGPCPEVAKGIESVRHAKFMISSVAEGSHDPTGLGLSRKSQAFAQSSRMQGRPNKVRMRRTSWSPTPATRRGAVVRVLLARDDRRHASGALREGRPHAADATDAAAAARGSVHSGTIEVLYLPAYSPQLTPIEQARSVAKRAMGKKVIGSKAALKEERGAELEQLKGTPEKVPNMFKEPDYSYILE